MIRKKKKGPVRKFRVRSDGFGDFDCDADSASQARWKAFKAAREAGYFRDGFKAFLQHGFHAFEVRP